MFGDTCNHSSLLSKHSESVLLVKLSTWVSVYLDYPRLLASVSKNDTDEYYLKLGLSNISLSSFCIHICLTLKIIQKSHSKTIFKIKYIEQWLKEQAYENTFPNPSSISWISSGHFHEVELFWASAGHSWCEVTMLQSPFPEMDSPSASLMYVLLFLFRGWNEETMMRKGGKLWLLTQREWIRSGALLIAP